tara:strand:+ start:73 stop:894 length:822 start_codon:yes stop_codon:yes gene_type:complete
MQTKRMSLINYFKNTFLFKNNTTLAWDSESFKFNKIENFKSIPLNLLIGLETQKKLLLDNTVNFAKGNFTNNALLWGVRGNGKSTMIKSTVYELKENYKKLKLIQINKNDLRSISYVFNILNIYKNFRFIIFIDDLSFVKEDLDYKLFKSIIEGSIINQPQNVIIYVTSNRRHLMSKDMIDNEKSSAIHTDENIEEKISLSDRFGLWIGFHNLSQKQYLEIIENYFSYYKMKFSEEIPKKSIQWSIQRGNRTGRVAWQFILDYAAKKNLKITF